MGVIKVGSEKKVDVDDVLDRFGIFGRYHSGLMCLLFFAFLSNQMYCANYIFAAEEVSYRCKYEEEGIHQCTANSTYQCADWIYDNPDSFVAYFNLACQDWKRTFVGTVHSFGYMCGLLLVGPMSDKFGRKNTAIILGVSGGVFGVARSFSTWYWFYIAMEFMEAAIGDICSPLYVLSLEVVSSKKKLTFYMMCGFGYAFGGVALALAAWLTPNWRWLLRSIYGPAFLFIFYKFLMDESPRWLLVKGKKDEAITVLMNAAKKNKIDLDKNSLDKLTCDVSPNVKFNELIRSTFSSKQLRLRFFICLVWWTTSTFVNYGLMINSVSLQGNKYINFALTSLVDIPGVLIITFVLIKYKRKLPLMLSFFTGAALCIAQPFLPNLPWLSIVFYMASKLMSSFFFSITYLYTTELFPTYTRNSMHALCSSLGRLGAIIAPQTPLLEAYWSGLPSLVFGLAALIAGLTTLFVPDVSNDSLPDTVLQAEALGKSKKALEARNDDIS